MSITHVLLIAIIFIPVLPIYSVEGISSVVRLDFVLSLLLILLMLGKSKFRRHIVSKNNLIIIICVPLLYLWASQNVFTAIAQILLYFSIYCAYYCGVHLTQHSRRVFLDLLYFLLAINCLIHVIYHFFHIDSFLITHINGIGQIENDIIFGLFGISKMPFQFILYVGSFLFMAIIRDDPKDAKFFFGIILALISASTAESRVGFFALLIGVLFIFKPKSTIVISLLAIIFIPYVLTDKMSFILKMDFSDIIEDPSLAMRLINFHNFIDWLSFEKILFGGGAFANLQFTNTYGEAGALDMFFVRILAEFGFPLVVSGLVYILVKLVRIIKNSSGIKMQGVVGWTMFIFIYCILNEGVVASRSGHLVFLIWGLILSMQVGSNSSHERQEQISRLSDIVINNQKNYMINF